MSSTRDSNLSTADPNIENCLMTFVVHFPPSSYIWSSAAACLVNIVLAIAGTILNLFVVFLFWKSPKLHSKLRYFAVMILSLIDLLVTTVVHPLFLIKTMNEALGKAECWHASAYYITLTCLSGASFWTLFTISIEKYLSIVHPIFHRRAVNKRRFVSVCIFFFFLNITITNIRLYKASLSRIANVAVAIMCSTYVFVFFSIFRVARAKLSKASPKESPNGQRKSEMTFIREVKMANILIAIVAVYVLCILPSGVLSTVQNPSDKDKKPSAGVIYALPWATTLTMMSSTLNCLVFFWANRELKKEGIRIVRRLFSL